MLIDLRCGGPDLLEADVAIVGAGAAGITLARSLVARGLEVLVLESGGLDYEPASADLNRGENIGQPYYDLEDSRLRFFGGTTAIWGGRCAELDPIDLERREWVPHSGWPITFDELVPWYAKAREVFGRRTTDGSSPTSVLDRLAGDELAVRHWSFDENFERFGAANNRHLISDPRVQVAIHATVREFIPSSGLGSVDHLQVKAPGGKSHRARARAYILAAGGLENPRILLASNSVSPTGLGNGHDLVGRFFMEHPHARGGRICNAPRWTLLRAFRPKRRDGVETAPLITLSEESQRRQRVLNSALTIASRPPVTGTELLTKRAYNFLKHQTPPSSFGRALWRSYRRIGRAARPAWSAAAMARLALGMDELALVIRAEQAPNPDSRVMLGNDRDATGMPRIVLDWRLGRQDVETVRTLVNSLAREAKRTGLGAVEAAEWLKTPGSDWLTDPLISTHAIAGYHHIGTTRMADDPRHGVTDAFGRVHGIENLYVAGSSLFPTSGWANPTLTIVALALRTADRVAAQLKSRPAESVDTRVRVETS